MSLVLCYTKTGCVTGFSLYKKLKETLGRQVRRLRVGESTSRPSDFVIRLGNKNSIIPEKPNAIVLNSAASVSNASNKSTMVRLLQAADGVNTLSVCFIRGGELPANLDEFKDADGFMFIRGAGGKVRYDNELKLGDTYVSKPLAKKKREYRVHVFNGRVMAAYEKVPQEEGVRIFNNKTCRFSRVRPELEGCRLDSLGIDMAIKSVQALGLDLAGVDLCYTGSGDNKKWYVIEVNSSPGLNSVNIAEYAREIVTMYNSMQQTGGVS